MNNEVEKIITEFNKEVKEGEKRQALRKGLCDIREKERQAHAIWDNATMALNYNDDMHVKNKAIKETYVATELHTDAMKIVDKLLELL